MDDRVAEVVEVVLRHGRYFLVVRGVYVAMEGDVCRDPAFPGIVWTHETLTQAAVAINENTFVSAEARFFGDEM